MGDTTRFLSHINNIDNKNKMNNGDIEKLSKKELQQLLKALDPEKTVVRVPAVAEEADDEPIEKPRRGRTSKKQATPAPEEVAAPAPEIDETPEEVTQHVELTARGTPRKRNMTDKQLETVRANAQRRKDASLQKKEAERLMLEQIKQEEAAKLEKKLRQKAKVEVAKTVTSDAQRPQTAAPARTQTAPVRTQAAPQAAPRPAVVAAEPPKAATRALSMQEYLRQFGL